MMSGHILKLSAQVKTIVRSRVMFIVVLSCLNKLFFVVKGLNMYSLRYDASVIEKLFHNNGI